MSKRGTRVSIEDMNRMKTEELKLYWKTLKNRVASRVQNFEKAGVEYTPALESLKDYGYFKGLKRPDSRSQLLKDVRYFDKFLYDYSTSKLRGFENLTNENLTLLTGMHATLDKHSLSEFFRTINKIRENRKDLRKGTDRYNYRAVFKEVLTYIQKGYEQEDILNFLQNRYDEIINEAQEKRDEEYYQDVEEMEELYAAAANDTIGSLLESNPVESLYDMTEVDKFRKKLGLI